MQSGGSRQKKTRLLPTRRRSSPGRSLRHCTSLACRGETYQGRIDRIDPCLDDVIETRQIAHRGKTENHEADHSPSRRRTSSRDRMLFSLTAKETSAHATQFAADRKNNIPCKVPGQFELPSPAKVPFQRPTVQLGQRHKADPEQSTCDVALTDLISKRPRVSVKTASTPHPCRRWRHSFKVGGTGPPRRHSRRLVGNPCADSSSGNGRPQ